MSAPVQVPTTPTLDDFLRIRDQEGNGASDRTSSISSTAEKILKTATLEETIDTEAKQSVQEMHQDRMFVLREQMKFLNETEWRYQPIDVLIGCLAPDTRFP